MANEGIYRESTAAGGLPLPRALLWPLTIVIGAVALIAIVLSPALLGVVGHSAHGAWRLFKEGGGSMWLILFADLLGPVVIAVLGAFVVRGRRVPTGILFACAAIPFALALLGAWMGQRMTIRALSGESVDPEMKARILAEGVAETMATDIFGGLVACGAALAATLAAASAAASIDVRAASRDGAKPSAFGAIGAGACGALWLVATLVVGALRLRAAGVVALLPALPVLVIVPFAALAGRGAAVVRGWHDRAEGSRVAGALLVAAASALLAVLALQRGLEASSTAQALGAISGESVDPSQRLRILVLAIEEGRLAPASYAVHAVLGTATFGFALAPAIGSGKHPATPSAIISLVLGGALLAGALALGSSRASLPRAFADAAEASLPPGISLPVMVEALSNKHSGSASGPRIVVPKDGSGGAPETAADHAIQHHSRFAIYADKDATLAMVRARLPRSGASNVTFVATRQHPPDLDARIGYLAGYLGRFGYVTASFTDDPTATSSSEIVVVTVADDAVEIDGKRTPYPIPKGTDESGSSRGRKSSIRYVFRPSDTVERALRTIAAVEERQLYAWDLERAIVVDDGTRRAKPAPTDLGLGLSGLGTTGGFGPGGPGPLGGTPGQRAPWLRQGAVTVNGRLPPEVIQRIVRQNFGRLRLCYENGLRTDPKLHGRVTVKFVIDRSGAVEKATDGGSELPDKAVVACMVRAFASLSFPQPEGGIVLVVYPFEVSPGG